MTNDEAGAEPRIRPASAEDVDAVAALYEELHEAEWHGDPPFRIARPAWRAEVSSVLESPGIHLLVAEAGGVVGTVRVELGERPHGPVGEIRRLVVSRDWRGRGVGARLMAAAEELARARGAGDMRLTVLVGNDEARGFYVRRGYEEFAIRYRRRLG